MVFYLLRHYLDTFVTVQSTVIVPEQLPLLVYVSEPMAVSSEVKVPVMMEEPAVSSLVNLKTPSRIGLSGTEEIVEVSIVNLNSAEQFSLLKFAPIEKEMTSL